MEDTLYDWVVIVKPDLALPTPDSEKQLNRIYDEFNNSSDDYYADIISVVGVKRLAYPVSDKDGKKYSEGYYIQIRVRYTEKENSKDKLANLRAFLQDNPHVLKFINVPVSDELSADELSRFKIKPPSLDTIDLYKYIFHNEQYKEVMNHGIQK